MFKLAIKVLEVEQTTLLNALDRVVYGSTKASIKERLQLIEQELDELYALTEEKDKEYEWEMDHFDRSYEKGDVE